MPLRSQETRPEEVDCPSLFMALACGIEACKPVLIRVGPAELLQEEAIAADGLVVGWWCWWLLVVGGGDGGGAVGVSVVVSVVVFCSCPRCYRWFWCRVVIANDLQQLQDAYGIWAPKVSKAPEIVNTRHKHSIMVLPLAGRQAALRKGGYSSEQVTLRYYPVQPLCAEETIATDSPPDAMSALVSRTLRATQHVSCSVLLQPMLQGCSEKAVDRNEELALSKAIVYNPGRTHPELSVDYYDGDLAP
eukprot:Skav203342  [mRNA]  locus=scaffold284:705318:711484:- [translate_table: standard]